MLSGNLVNHTAVINCPHGGRASGARGPSSPVCLDGQPLANVADTLAVVGCPHTVDGVPRPCVTVRWTVDHDSVLVDGVPVLLDSGAGQCLTAQLVSQGPPLVFAAPHGGRGVVCR